MNNCRICDAEITRGQSLRSGSLCEMHENLAFQYHQEAKKIFPVDDLQGPTLCAVVDKIDAYVEEKLTKGG
jgi:hypothetical protein